MKKGVIWFIVLLVIIMGAGYYFSTKKPSRTSPATETPSPSPSPSMGQTGTSSTQVPLQDKSMTVIGTSREGASIAAYHFGTGTKEVLFVGGIHGGYEWNTTLVAYNTMDYLKEHPEVIPGNVKVTVIPVLNPDGLKKVVGTTTRFTAANVSPSQETQIAGRFNANTVDLNRNFDCDWQAKGTWQNRSVSGGSSAFSEPESQAIKTYIEGHPPTAVVAWFSAAGGVYSSNCHGTVLPLTKTLTETYAKASGYPAYENFDFYVTTGDMTNWLAKNNIPAISVLLSTHTDTEWGKNQAGITATLRHFAQ